MTIAMQPIYTQTVGSGGVGIVSFNNIPQTFTDLVIQMSVRTTRNNYPADNLLAQINNDGSSLYSSSFVYGNGSTVSSGRTSGQTSLRDAILINGDTATANTFGTAQITIPNYTSSNFKSVIVDGVSEDNSSTGLPWLAAGLYRSTNPITAILFSPQNSPLIKQYSTFTIYGITKG